MVDLIHDDPGSLPEALQKLYRELYDARQQVAPLLVTPAGERALGVLDKALTAFHALASGAAAFGAAAESPEFRSLVARMMAGEDVSPDEIRASVSPAVALQLFELRAKFGEGALDSGPLPDPKE
jgi:hypothetical protein